MKILMWSPDQAKKELALRLKNAMESRRDIERSWVAAERAVFMVSGIDDVAEGRILGADGVTTEDADVQRRKVAVNKVFKNYRFLHSQLSANPPTVVCRPTSSDTSDGRKADAADRLVRYAIRAYKLQEHIDLCSAQTLLYGTGFLKTSWDPYAGEILEYDRQKGELTMEGDIDVCVPQTWNIFIDPDADVWDKVRYVFERLYVPFEEAILRWPKQQDLLTKMRKKNEQAAKRGSDGEGASAMMSQKYDVVEVFEYWEKGLPVNGMQGRFAYCLKDGTLLCDVEESPQSFSVEKDEGGNIVVDSDLRIAELPYHIFTDIDNPGSCWGKATAVYQIPLQEIHNAVINAMIDSVRAHGVGRLIMPEGCELAEESITNTPTEIIRTTGREKPTYIPPMQLPAAMDELINVMSQGVDDMAGVNESMFGQQSREQSGFSMQYATNQGNMIRRRLFNKYVFVVESMFRGFLNLVRKHWNVQRTILVLGREKAFEALDLEGADLAGGFDLVVEYGASLSLDPTSRRQEILTLMPVFKEAGIPMPTILAMLKLNELENLYDVPQKGRERQSEIFTRMIQTGDYVQPEELQDHQSMLAYANEFLMSAEFRDLKPEYKALITRHVKARELLAAQGAQMPGGQPAPGGAPAGGAAPAPGGMPATPGGDQTQVTQVPPLQNS